MANEGDLGYAENEFHLGLSLRKQAEKAKAEGLSPKGRCYSQLCGEKVPAGAVFCDSDCRKDYEDVEAASKRNGRRF